MMKVVCSWCERSMGEKMGPDGITTHGICAACQKMIDTGTKVCEVHGRYIPKLSWLDHKPTCPRCDQELRDMSPTLAEVNERRGHGEGA
jgi:hypothetical protein